MEQLPAATYRAALDEEGSGLYVSPQIESLTGFTPAEWCVRPSLWRTRIHPDDRDAVLEKLKRSLTEYEPFVTKYRLLTESGEEIVVRDEAAVVRGAGGRPLYLQGTMADITERDRMEQELLKGQNSKLVPTSMPNPRGEDPEVLARLARELDMKVALVTKSCEDALRHVRAHADKRDLILVTGSFYLAGEAHRVLDSETKI